MDTLYTHIQLRSDIGEIMYFPLSKRDDIVEWMDTILYDPSERIHFSLTDSEQRVSLQPYFFLRREGPVLAISFSTYRGMYVMDTYSRWLKEQYVSYPLLYVRGTHWIPFITGIPQLFP